MIDEKCLEFGRRAESEEECSQGYHIKIDFCSTSMR